MSSEEMRSAIKTLQETTIILSHIDKIQSVRPEFGPPSFQSEKLRLKIEKNLSEIAEKLHRLIGPQ